MNSISDPTLKQAFSLDDPSVLQRTNFTPELTAEQRDAWKCRRGSNKAD